MRPHEHTLHAPGNRHTRCPACHAEDAGAARERAIDREVQRRLASDRAYRNAENAEEQAQREQEIEDEVAASLLEAEREAPEQQAAYDERWYR